jgi:alpha-L-fucosidase 2
MFKKWIFLSIIALLFLGCKKIDVQDDILWYSGPAQVWEDALPLGNGRIGVMLFGNPATEHLQLNDDSMWPGDDGWVEPDGNAEDLKNIRSLLFDGNNTEADKMFVEKFSNKSIVRSHQTLGDLYIDLNHKNITDYRRELNISTATACVSYKTDGQLVTEKIFVSHPHQAIVLEITTEADKGLNGKVHLSRPKDEGKQTVNVETTEDNLLIMKGQVTQHDAKFRSEPAPIVHGVKFETRLKINNTDGTIKKGKDYLELKNVKKATFYLVSNSSYYYDNFRQQNSVDLAAIEGIDFETLQEIHIQDYRELYNRVDFKLSNHTLDTLATDKRIERIKEGTVDLGLEVLLFQYGRYLLIGSSREGTNPANLQGLMLPI